MSKNNIQRNHGNNLFSQTLSLRYGDIDFQLDVPEGVWNPTPHGNHLANMLLKLDFTGEKVLELGSGCGNHTLLIARNNPAELTVTEITQEIVDNTQHNLEKHGVQVPVRYLVADWTQVEGGPYDVLVTNPPFAKSGKRYYRYFIDTLINDAHKLLKPGGRLIFVQSSMANVPRSIALMEEWGMQVRILGETSGPFREYYFEDDRFMLNMNKFPGAYFMVNGQYHEKLTAFEATLPS